jgi:hypothetical protein
VPRTTSQSHELLLASHSEVLISADSLTMPAESVAVARVR